eukprot:CAMPEP_0181467476 /NCGR_PEP_ID=MMETSP1110-20121109/37000_1 /TAXON_ID=174948 /ORGANISM="Symbiodinium sp., Strain CCMP421" /LENGTH=262 /DNA_ID=CAMNT_0023592307 /DNA_START=30 /DNA_END=818 /DNA_ORIENTATION=-
MQRIQDGTVSPRRDDDGSSDSIRSSKNTVSPRFMRGLRLPPLAAQTEEAGMKHLLEETPSKWFLDDQKYCRREVLEENVIDEEMLKRIDFFRNFGPTFLDELLSTPESIRKVLVMPGTVLLREGASGDSMMVISKGRVAASVNGRVVKHLGEGSYFGELVFLGASLVRSVTVTATTFCDVRIIYHRSFQRIADKYPEVQATLNKFDLAQCDLRLNAKAASKLGKALAEALAQVFQGIHETQKNAASRLTLTSPRKRGLSGLK